jgi:hypothetical protein
MQDEIKIRPEVPKRLFWEYDYDRIDWQKESVGIIERVIERGTRKDWENLIAFYGKDRVVASLIGEINYLRDDVITEACNYFGLQPENLKCYIRKRSRPTHWF